MKTGFVLISGCSSGGKSTLLVELRGRGYRVVEEPGRRIIAHELTSGGAALPWVDAEAFLRRAIDVALKDIDVALKDIATAQTHSGWVFFDRGLVDAASALEALTGEPVLRLLCSTHRYHARVFMTPPWPEIYVTDAERRHGIEAAIAEYQRLMQTLPALGYDVMNLPKISPSPRADLVLATLGGGTPPVA
ncbi:putative ATPase [Bradyrhizobium sp. i1.8.4]|uniref:AAA family ATPase n=1 Tax=unclassified Bradyrhizobium TaxID=2631580 RepID=UPI003D1CB99D